MIEITFRDIEELLGIEDREDDRAFTGLAGFEDAGSASIVFAETPVSLQLALASAAGLILAPMSAADPDNARLLPVKNPKYIFAILGRWFEERRSGFIDPSAKVHPEARVGCDPAIGAGAVIEAGVILGDRCVIGARATIHSGVRLGDRCIIQSGVVLGSIGFGYVKGPEGRYLRFPQQGTLWIGDDVEIGANSTVDRGALGETRIGRGTKIDNLVHIAHNCIVGEDVIIAAQVGMAGSCVIEDGAMLGGQAGLGERVTIGKGVMLGGQGGVLPGKRLDGEGQVFWGTPAQRVKEYLRGLARIKRGA